MSRGFVATLAAFVCWGLVPLYWRLLRAVPVLQIMAHRVVFCCVAASLFLVARERAAWLRPLREDRRVAPMLLASSLLIAANWGLYVYGVNDGRIVATSLGYFVNPLVSVLLGVVFLGERLSRLRWLAVALAALGVVYLTIRAGSLPWLSLGLATTFGGYGLVRKTVPVEAVAGLALESLFLLPVALVYLIVAEARGVGAFGHDLRTTSLLMLSGVVTALPLAAFAYGARRLPLSTVGVVQYVAPSLALVCAVFVFGEPFTPDQRIGFGCIWGALAIYALDALRLERRSSGALREEGS